MIISINMNNVTSPYIVDKGFIEELGKRTLGQYRLADPFPHVVIENFLPSDFLDNVVTDFDAIPENSWQVFKKDGYAYKLEAREMEDVGVHGREFFNQLNAPTFLRFLETLTGISGLIPDPYLMGAGFHKIPRGARLAIHADFNWYEHFKLYRRVNLLCYLNEEWPENYGGHLELWDQSLIKCVKRVTPIFNRCVIFNTTDTSFHGYPHPLTCPDGSFRKAATLYYYTNGRPATDGTLDPHKTFWKDIV